MHGIDHPQVDAEHCAYSSFSNDIFWCQLTELPVLYTSTGIQSILFFKSFDMSIFFIKI